MKTQRSAGLGRLPERAEEVIAQVLAPAHAAGDSSTPHRPGMAMEPLVSWRAASAWILERHRADRATRPGWAAAAAASASLCTWKISRASSGSASTGTRG